MRLGPQRSEKSWAVCERIGWTVLRGGAAAGGHPAKPTTSPVRPRASQGSAFPGRRRSGSAATEAELLPLAYFAIDPDYNVPAALKPAEKETVIEMPTSTGELRRQRIVGTLEFVLKGQPLKLTATVEADAPNLDQI